MKMLIFRPGSLLSYTFIGIMFMTLCGWNAANAQSRSVNTRNTQPQSGVRNTSGPVNQRATQLAGRSVNTRNTQPQSGVRNTSGIVNQRVIDLRNQRDNDLRNQRDNERNQVPITGPGFITTPGPNPRPIYSRSSVIFLIQRDIILSINGERVYNSEDTMDALDRSPTMMNLDIRRGARILHLQVTLNRNSPRPFGVDFQDTPLGVQITFVYPGTPATRCRVLGESY